MVVHHVIHLTVIGLLALSQRSGLSPGKAASRVAGGALQSHCIPCSADSLYHSSCHDPLATLSPVLGPAAMLTFLTACPLFSLKHACIFSWQLLPFRKKRRKSPPIIAACLVLCLPHKTLMLLRCSLRSASCPTSQSQANSLAPYFAEPSF